MTRTPERRGVTWHARGPRVVFTPAGYLLLVFAFALILDTFNDPSTLKRLASSFSIAVPFVDCLLLIRQRRRLEVRKVWADRIRAGHVARVGVLVHNAGDQDALVTVRLDAPRQPVAWQWVLHRQEAAVYPVLSGQTLPRGAHAFPGLGWALHSPLRLARLRQPLDVPPDTPTDVVVWPAPWTETLPPFPLSGAAIPSPWRGQAAGRPDPREGQQALNTPGVHGWLRTWRQGDRLAHLAHKASAHRDQWLVQTASAQPQDTPLDVVLSLTWALGVTSDLEKALSLLGTMVEHALSQGRRVGLILGDHTWAPDRGEPHKQALLDALARFVPGETP